MIVLIESHERNRAPRQPEVAVLDCGARWGEPAEFGFDRTDAETENESRGGFNTVDRGETRTSVKVWNLSPVWRAYEVVEIKSSEDPDLPIEATVAREMLIPVGTRIEKYVIAERTALINHLRGLLIERGVVAPKGRKKLEDELADFADEEDDRLSGRMRLLVEDLRADPRAPGASAARCGRGQWHPAAGDRRPRPNWKSRYACRRLARPAPERNPVQDSSVSVNPLCASRLPAVESGQSEARQAALGFAIDIVSPETRS